MIRLIVTLSLGILITIEVASAHTPVLDIPTIMMDQVLEQSSACNPEVQRC